MKCCIEGRHGHGADTMVYPHAVRFCPRDSDEGSRAVQQWHDRMGEYENTIEVNDEQVNVVDLPKPEEKDGATLKACMQRAHKALIQVRRAATSAQKKSANATYATTKKETGFHDVHVFHRLPYIDPSVHFVNDPFHALGNFAKDEFRHNTQPPAAIKWKQRQAYYSQHGRFADQLDKVYSR